MSMHEDAAFGNSKSVKATRKVRALTASSAGGGVRFWNTDIGTIIKVGEKGWSLVTWFRVETWG